MSISRETRIFAARGERRERSSRRLTLLICLAAAVSLTGLSKASALLGDLGGRWSTVPAKQGGNVARDSRPSTTPQPAAAIAATGMSQDPEGNSNLSAQTCTVNCSATVPATAQPNAQVLFQAMVQATGCTATPTFRWNFGDGSAVSTSQNPSHSYSVAGTYQWSLTASVASGSNLIETIAGGLGEGNPATQATIQEVPQLARDPLGRGVFVIDSTSEFFHLRFINTSSTSVTLAGVTIAPGVIRSIAGGGASTANDVPARTADLAVVTGLAVSPSGNLAYLLNSTDGLLRVINLSSSSVPVNGTALTLGRFGLWSVGLDRVSTGWRSTQRTGRSILLMPPPRSTVSSK